MQPKLTIKSQPIDLELCELLGNQPSDFIVLCLDGIQMDTFGTPYDSPAARQRQQLLCDSLNDKSEKSRWPEAWMLWKKDICKQFGLPDTTTSDDYRPVVSFKISRVCAGYSEHLHAAIGLFETLADKIGVWRVSKTETCLVIVEDKRSRVFIGCNNKPSLAIAEAIRALLKGQSG